MVLGEGAVSYERGTELVERTANYYFREMCSGSEAGSYLWRIDFVYASILRRMEAMHTKIHLEILNPEP